MFCSNSRRQTLGSRCVLLIALLALSGGAFAQATRTFVSGVGDDANPCSRTAPCKTFAGAISKTAAGGLINVLDPGGFGSVTINKAITIDGASIGWGGILNAASTGIIVNAGTSDVVRIRNLAISGVNAAVAGITFSGGNTLAIDDVLITDHTEANAYGIKVVSAGNSRLIVSNTSISNSTRAGILLQPVAGGTVRASISKSHISRSGAGHGVRVEDRSIVSIDDSVITGNFGNGVQAFSASDPASVTIANSELSGNGFGATIGAAVVTDGALAVAYISGNTLTNNNNGLRVSHSGSLVSFGNNAYAGNVNDGAPTSTTPLR